METGKIVKVADSKYGPWGLIKCGKQMLFFAASNCDFAPKRGQTVSFQVRERGARHKRTGELPYEAYDITRSAGLSFVKITAMLALFGVFAYGILA